MEGNGLTQEVLARNANVSQSTVSRALKSVPKRYSEPWRKLFTYAAIIDENTDKSTGVGNGSTAGGIKRITSAVQEVWDGSDESARAIANIIHALGGLMPKRE